ncbi:hypothetical protein RJ639_023915 [Escallonia herrerae]|uniref:Transposase (putative) gypsy type domain-containing protein n=1 Tax=Escallonia herrerae TaxID=1293975 RepID=A0AA88V200_9ASTE|nr:hypothetical protein RJ639_023915 [Escallonia herrerae]
MILFGQNSVLAHSAREWNLFGLWPRSLCSGRVFGHDSVQTKFCSATVTLLGQSVRTRFCSDRTLLGHGHSARAECSDTILFGKNSVRPRSLCSGRVFGHDSVRTELLGHGSAHGHSARAECSNTILFGQNSVQPRSLCSGKVFEHDSFRTEFCSATVTLLGQSVRTELCSATVTLLGQSVRTQFCSGRILFGHGHSVSAECSDTILFGKDSVRPLPWFPPRVSFFINVFERELRIFKFLYSSACDTCVVDEPLCFPRNGYMGFLYKKRTFSSFLPHSNHSEAFFTSSKPLFISSFCSAFQVFVVCLEDMSESSVSVSSPEEDIVISSSSSSRSGDVKDQAEDEANPRPWYTADEKSNKMSTEDLVELLREYPLLVGWYARLPGLQEPANYGTKYETGIYEEQVRSGYRLPLHPFALRFFEHYRMAPGQLVPNGWRKLVGLIYLVQTSGYKPDTTDFMRVFFEICFVKGVANCPGWYYIHNRQRLLKWGPKSNKGWHSRYFFVGRSDKGKLPFDREWNPYSGAVTPPPAPTISSTFPVESASLESQREEERKAAKCRVAPAPKKTRVIPPDHSPQIVEKVSVEEDPIFRPRCTLRSTDVGMPDSQISEQHLVHGVLPRDKEIFQNQTHETFACSFAQAVYTMYASGSEMLSRFEMARQVAAEEAQQKRDAIKETQEATHRAEEMSNREEDYLARIATLEKRLERIKRKAAEEVTKAQDQGIRDFLDGNAGDEWLKKRTEDGLEIYDLGFTKAKEMLAERFPDIPLEDFVLPAVPSPSRETVMPSEEGDATVSHLPGEGPSGMHPRPRF